jgi:hypothetical protein
MKAHSPANSLNPLHASLIGPEFSLIGADAFPVPVSRELVKQGADFATINPLGFRPLEPVFSLFPGIWRRDGFAADCVVSQIKSVS